MKTYNLICKTDLYHAARIGGFDKFTGIKVIDTFNSLDEANEALFDAFCEDAVRRFANWGLACIYASRPNDESLSAAGSDKDGRRYYRRDIYTYSVEVNG